MTKDKQCYKAPKQKANRLSKSEYKAYSLWVWEQYPICEICQSASTDDVHHLKYGSYKDDSSIYPVCRSCHEYCHQNKQESQELYLDKAKQIRRDYEER